MKLFFLLSLTLFTLACESKPTRPEVSAKPTPESLQPAAVDFMIWVESGPDSTENLLLAHAPVTKCLRDGVLPDSPPLQLMILGMLNGAGRLSSPRIDGVNPGIRACLQEALKSLRLEPGSRALVKIHITRGGVAPAGAKPFQVPGKSPKKFE